MDVDVDVDVDADADVDADVVVVVRLMSSSASVGSDRAALPLGTGQRTIGGGLSAAAASMARTGATTTW